LRLADASPCADWLTSKSDSAGRITGVMDERGKFIFISPEEMTKVADYVKEKGRVSIAHLANKSNEFIDFTPKMDVQEPPLIEAA
jgi:hypothetical protein